MSEAFLALADRIAIYADGADLATMRKLEPQSYVKGFTTNPTLARQAGVTDYMAFAKEVAHLANGKSVSVEVLSDDVVSIEREAHKLRAIGKSVVVKVPVMNTRGETNLPVIRRLSHEWVPVNVTAILTRSDLMAASADMHPDVPYILSVFAGRIADTGRDPAALIETALPFLSGWEGNAKRDLLWASTREVFNIVEAANCGCTIITVSMAILEKAQKMVGTDLGELSMATVRQFDADAKAAGFTL